MKYCALLLTLISACAPGQPFHRTTLAEVQAEKEAEIQSARDQAEAQRQQQIHQEAISTARFEQRYPYLIFLRTRWHDVCDTSPNSEKCIDVHGQFLAEDQRVRGELETELRATFQ